MNSCRMPEQKVDIDLETRTAAINPELVDYAATCGKEILDVVNRETEAQKGKS